jgi:transketolase
VNTPEPERLDPSSWHARSPGRTPSFVAGEVLADLAEADPRVVVLTADLAYSNRTQDFAVRHPDRFFNVGIAEHNMVSMAAGMAAVGLIPYVSTFAAFVALECVEQIRTDLAYPQMPVRILAHHAGFSLGYYGTSHHATEDVGLLRPIAGLSIVAPCDAASLTAALGQAHERPGPVYVRLGRGRDDPVYDATMLASWQLGVPYELRAGEDLVILAYGATVAPALAAAEKAAEDGLQVGVVDVHTLKPLDTEAIVGWARKSRRGLLVVEEHNIIGGLASAVADCLLAAGVLCPLHRLGVPDEYVPVGPPTHLYRHYRLDAVGIAETIRTIVQGFPA